jgi:hypothetical protein
MISSATFIYLFRLLALFTFHPVKTYVALKETVIINLQTLTLKSRRILQILESDLQSVKMQDCTGAEQIKMEFSFYFVITILLKMIKYHLTN